MKTRYLFFLLLIISIVPLLDLFHPGLPITHDGQDHVARIANFYKNLEEGNLIPRWAGNLNWGYGHPILMFLYPLPSYVASFFHFLGFSLVDSTKLVFGLAFVASGLAMYLWVSEFLGRWPAFAAALLYMFAPYRFVDLYVRGAIGEHLAFVFLPLVCYFLLKALKTNFYSHYRYTNISALIGVMKKSYWYIVVGTLSIAGLILSHNAISLMFLPIIFLYAIYLLWQAKSRRLLVMSYGLLVILGFGLSAFFWIPAFFEGKYTLRDIVTTGEYASRFVNFQSLIFGPWNYGGSGQFTTQVGIVQWLIVLASLVAVDFLRKKKNSLWIFGAVTIVIFWLTVFLMTSSSSFIWETVTTLQKFQFPWRFLSVSVFAIAVLGGLVVFAVPKKSQLVVCFLLILGLLLFNKEFWHAKGYLEKPESFYIGVYDSTTDTGESSPVWSVRFMERRPKAAIEVIDRQALVTQDVRTSTFHAYTVIAKEQTRLVENTLYFPGWEVLVDGQRIGIEFQDPANRGLMTFFVEKGNHFIIIKFGETKLRLLANLISAISFVIIIIYSILKAKLWRRFL